MIEALPLSVIVSQGGVGNAERARVASNRVAVCPPPHPHGDDEMLGER